MHKPFSFCKKSTEVHLLIVPVSAHDFTFEALEIVIFLYEMGKLVYC